MRELFGCVVTVINNIIIIMSMRYTWKLIYVLVVSNAINFNEEIKNSLNCSSWLVSCVSALCANNWRGLSFSNKYYNNNEFSTVVVLLNCQPNRHLNLKCGQWSKLQFFLTFKLGELLVSSTALEREQSKCFFWSPSFHSRLLLLKKKFFYVYFHHKIIHRIKNLLVEF